MIAIPNMSKPKRCVEEWDFGLMGNPCKFLESDMSCLLQPESEPFDCGENYEHCPLIEIVRCGECKHRDPEDKKCDCGMFERQGCIFPVADDYFCKYGERRSE